MRTRLLFVSLATLTAASTSSPASAFQMCSIERASVGAGGAQVLAPASIVKQCLSANGRFVAFQSNSGTLVPGDTNNTYDIFVYDRQTGTTTRESVDAAGNEIARGGYEPFLSGDGRWLLFSTDASLDPADTNLQFDLYVRDRQTGTLIYVTRSITGGPSNQHTYRGSLSADGNFAIFVSRASNLVVGDTNNLEDVFVRDLTLGVTSRVSVGSAGSQGTQATIAQPSQTDEDMPRLSADGRIAVFGSRHANLVAGDTNVGTFLPDTGLDVFTHDRVTRITTRVSVSAGGAQASGYSELMDISQDARFIAFRSFDRSLDPPVVSTPVYVRDTVAGTTRYMGIDTAGARTQVYPNHACLSGDGRYWAFGTAASLEASDTNGEMDVYRRDVLTGVTTRVTANGVQPDGPSIPCDLSGDGSTVLVLSYATNLVPSDTNGMGDVFAYHSCAPTPFTSYCGGTPANCPCGNGGVDGRGCENSSTSGGARLIASGTPSLSGDTMQLAGSGMPSTATALYFQALAPAASPTAFGDGLLCVQGAQLRLGVRAQVGGASTFPSTGTLSTIGLIGAAGTREYQIYYRDSVAFCTTATFNLSNAIRIGWVP